MALPSVISNRRQGAPQINALVGERGRSYKPRCETNGRKGETGEEKRV